jgi:hypothetical protein
MKGDVSRAAFDARRFSRVVAQQGRIQLDADWNEQQAIIDHRLRAALADVFGHAGLLGVAIAPHAAPGFGIHTHGGCLFDASSPGIDVLDPSPLGGPYTLEVWLKPADPDAQTPARATVASRSGEFHVSVDAKGYLVFERFEASAASAVALSSRQPLRRGAFSHVACVFTGRAAEIWVDGELARRSAAGPPAENGAPPLRIGASDGAGGAPTDSFAGTIEDVRVWRSRRFGPELRYGYLHHPRRGEQPAGEAHSEQPALHWTCEHPADGLRLAPRELCVSPGRCYVDGVMCENPYHAPLSAPASHPGSEAIVYLDVWERYVSAFEDPTIADVALGGVDTTGRLQTVAHVCVTAPAEFEPIRARSHDRGEIALDVATRILQDNLLYRFEVHAPGIAADESDGGDVVTIEPERASERTWRVVGGANVDDWSSGQYLQILNPGPTGKLMRFVSWNAPAPGARTFTVDEVPDGVNDQIEVRPVASVLWSKQNANFVFPLEGAPAATKETTTFLLAGDVQRADILSIGQVVVVGDENAATSFRPGFVSTIKDISTDVPGQIEVVVGGRLDRVGPGAVLRCWDGIVPAEAISGKPRKLADVAVSFAAGGAYRTGDYWTARLRPDDPNTPLEWPRDGSGKPVFVPPAGIAHTYAELARVHAHHDGPHVERDLRRIVRSVAELMLDVRHEHEGRPVEVDLGYREPPRREEPPHREQPPHHEEPAPPLEPPFIVVEAAPQVGLVLAHSAPQGYADTGSVVEAVVEYPQWSQHLPAPHKGGAAAAVAIEGAIYLLYEGGTLWRLDPSHADNRWERCCPYEAVRREYAVTAAGGYLFVLGGLDRDGRPSRFVDRYDPRADAWSDMTPPMRVARTRLAAAGNQRGIVVCGGVRRTWFGWRYVTETAEQFDIATNAWQRLDPMLVRRFGAAAAFAGGSLYLIGGKVARSPLARQRRPTARVDRFHVGSREWTREMPLHEPRAYAAAAALSDEEIVVVGGTWVADVADAERLRVRSGEVRRFPSPRRGRFGLAAVGGVVYAIAGRAGGSDLHDALSCVLVDRIRVYRPDGEEG